MIAFPAPFISFFHSLFQATKLIAFLGLDEYLDENCKHFFIHTLEIEQSNLIFLKIYFLAIKYNYSLGIQLIKLVKFFYLRLYFPL
jgi:hypothetical protein